MGRKSKPPVDILPAPESRTEVAPHDGLPPLTSYIDVTYARETSQALTRLFFMMPTHEEIDDTVALKGRIQKGLHVLCAKMPFIPSSNPVTPAIYGYCLEKGFSEDFTTVLVRLVINHLQGKHLTYDSLSTKMRAYRHLVDFLAAYTRKPCQLTLTDINKQFWLTYAEALEADSGTRKFRLFCDARLLFTTYPPTSVRGWLSSFTFGERNRNPTSEHISELADAGYSDRVMYQILALCLEGFQRRIEYLKRYEFLTEADMPTDWFYPGRDTRKPAHGAKLGRIKQGETRETEVFLLLSQWLNDEEGGYQVLIDHFILYHKAGLLRRIAGGKHWGGIATSLAGLVVSKKLLPQVRKFWETTAFRHGFSYKQGSNSFLLGYYVKKKTATESNIVIDQIAWCLANLLMMQTGVNKEVALSIPSRAENGQSILMRENSLFVSGDGSATEVELYGVKERSGVHLRKVIPIPIVKDSPLYEMLCDYESYVKVDPTGPFFEVSHQFAANWAKAGGVKDFAAVYPILDDDGKSLTSVQTPRFRKMFASGQLLDRIKGIKDANDLAEKLREDLNHGNLDMTLTHYLLKTNVGRSVIDIAIATITSEKLNEALRFKGKIALAEGTQVKKKVFLCNCEDPTNPSHDVAIAAECKHYDLCLGCERSVVTRFHLPYICLRILQYEKARRADPNIWPATFEDRWNIAHDALDQYVAKDKKNGQRLVDEAWMAAHEDRISLPPIINSNRM